ncbi:hypothetical protein, partial [Mangrovihabitans endophyticus]|uniref:hypothetical protein n=1 Tax=Mangrovihabitans endophyticus TaxID=1751298 RepID=UPI001E439087
STVAAFVFSPPDTRPAKVNIPGWSTSHGRTEELYPLLDITSFAYSLEAIGVGYLWYIPAPFSILADKSEPHGDLQRSLTLPVAGR